MQKPTIKSVELKKTGRFWSVTTDKKLLATVLYKKGAVAIQELIQQLAGIAPAKSEQKPEAQPAVSKAPRKGGNSIPKAAKAKHSSAAATATAAKASESSKPNVTTASAQPVSVG